MTEYNALLDFLAAHPGADRNELRELAGDDDRLDPDGVDHLLDDALEANEHYWVMRTGRFAPSKYDHSMTGEWRNDSL